MFLFVLFGYLAMASPAQTVVITAPDSIPLGAELEISWDKALKDRDFITIVPKDAPEGKYDTYSYANRGPWKTTAPEKAGDYEIRYLSSESRYPTVSKKPLKVTPITVTLKAAAQGEAGSPIEIEFSGGNGPRDFITIVPKDAPEKQYSKYEYAKKGSPITLNLPDDSGDYEIRYLSGRKYFTLAAIPVTVGGAEASLTAPAQANAGTRIDITWTGPGNDRDFITIVGKDVAEKKYDQYIYVKKGATLSFPVPEKPGDYEIRYLTGGSYKTLARSPLRVGAVQASVKLPDSVPAGSPLAIEWSGPNNERDYLTIVKADAKEGHYDRYKYTKVGNPIEFLAPEDPGTYEVRYQTGRKNVVLGRKAFTVVPVEASLDAPDQVKAGSILPVGWKGPGNPRDYISIARKDMPDEDWVRYGYVKNGNPLELRLPLQDGAYELRYVTGQKSIVLARRDIQLTPIEQQPGTLQVVMENGKGAAFANGTALELILDASGSMLKRLDGTRRIEIAKQVLIDLVQTQIPANMPVALRVFGHREADSCRTDLEMPMTPLNPAKAKSLISKIQAKNLAKTPIAASLEAVEQDLAAAKGQRIVILMTDGEETCGGDPAEVLRRLKDKGIDVRVNIVGFAINDKGLKQTFKLWADEGNGAYFDAKNAQQLSASVSQALQIPFDVYDASNEWIAEGLVGGDAIELPAGSYTVKTRETPARNLKVVVNPKERSTASLK